MQPEIREDRLRSVFWHTLIRTTQAQKVSALQKKMQIAERLINCLFVCLWCVCTWVLFFSFCRRYMRADTAKNKGRQAASCVFNVWKQRACRQWVHSAAQQECKCLIGKLTICVCLLAGEFCFFFFFFLSVVRADASRNKRRRAVSCFF